MWAYRQRLLSSVSCPGRAGGRRPVPTALSAASPSRVVVAATSTVAAFHPTRLCAQKRQTAEGYMAAAGKVGGEEKWAQAAMEYIYEKNHVNDARKRQADVDKERSVSAAYDRYSAVNEAIFEERMSRLLQRMTDALNTIQALGLNQTLDEATLLNTEQPPCNFRRPALTPPIPGYEPGFGLDVPQLKSQQMEYPPVVRPTDRINFGADGDDSFPFVDAHRVEDLTKACQEELRERHGAIREAAPVTGVEGEAWETYVALQGKALARQQLIFDLANDPELHERYEKEESFRRAELERRGLRPLQVEPARSEEEENNLHYAQVPAYEPFRVV